MSAITHNEAVDLFFSNRFKADIWGWIAPLLHRCARLQSIEEFLCGRSAFQRREAGIQLVPIHQIVASMDRQFDFTPSFLPRAGANANRWVHLYEALLAAEGFPEVELLRKGDRYAVVDGHHRISVARAAGLRDIAAHVVEVVE
jgi:hypothetical protein